MSQWQKVPILILGFNRPESLNEVLSQTSLQQFEKVIVSIDGPRSGNTNDQIANSEIRKIVSKTGFESQFSTLNRGSRAITAAVSSILDNHTSLIVVEDDLLFSPQSLRFVAERVLKLDKNTATVGGYSPRFVLNRTFKGNTWRESNYFCPWVWGTNQEIWKRYKQEINSQDLAQLVQSPTWNALSPSIRSKWFLRFLWCVNNPNLTWDYQMQFLHFRESLISVRPYKSLVTNHGFNNQGQRTHKEPIWNPKAYVNSMSGESNSKLNWYSNFMDSITFAADNKLLDSKLHRLARNLYK